MAVGRVVQRSGKKEKLIILGEDSFVAIFISSSWQTVPNDAAMNQENGTENQRNQILGL